MTQKILNRRFVFLAIWILSVSLLTSLPFGIAQDDPPPPADPVEEATEPVTPPTVSPTEVPLTPATQRPEPSQIVTVGGVTMELLFDRVPQGRAALIHVHGDEVSGARLRFLDNLTEFFKVENGDENDGYYGLLIADMDQNPRTYDFTVFAWLEDGSRISLPGQVEVVLGGFIRQDIDIPAERAYLTDVEIERGELARLDSVFDEFTPERLWDENGFELPIVSTFTSPFGAFRIINQSVPTRHTGWDLRAATGTPVRTMAAGRVAYAGLMDIRGNHVVIDHGYGIYSGYSHLSQIHVTRGQTISSGQIIGVSGNTGRSSGPHLHWELSVNGQWIDIIDFMQMWLP